VADVHRRHVLIEAPVEDVWAILSDPKTHVEWWPELVDVRVSDELAEGDEYKRVTRRLGFLDLVDGIWVAERLEHLKEAHFRCTVTGTYTRFALTPAQSDTFVELEAGMLPTKPRWRVAKAFSAPMIRRWVKDLLDGLPEVVARRRGPARAGDR
jgi:hypothetical protein